MVYCNQDLQEDGLGLTGLLRAPLAAAQMPFIHPEPDHADKGPDKL